MSVYSRWRRCEGFIELLEMFWSQCSSGGGGNMKAISGQFLMRRPLHPSILAIQKYDTILSPELLEMINIFSIL